jgi:hypothetical protein
VNIHGKVYEGLSNRQRIIAAMDAIAREDTAEVERLKSSSPIETYRQRGIAFSETIRALFETGLAVECDLSGAALSWWIVRATPEQSRELLKEMAAIEGGWQALLGDMGIASLTAAAPPRHQMVVLMLKMAPEPEPERVEEIHEMLRACIST